MPLSPYTYSPRKGPSLAKVLLVLFIFSTALIYAVDWYSDNRPNPIDERLHDLGYPTEGYIALKENGSLILKYAEGKLVVKTGDYLNYYPLTAEEAYTIARQHFAPINQKLKAAGINIRFFVKGESLIEKESAGQRYWCFEVWQDHDGTKLNTYNIICVNRQTRTVKIESPFDAISLEG